MGTFEIFSSGAKSLDEVLSGSHGKIEGACMSEVSTKLVGVILQHKFFLRDVATGLFRSSLALDPKKLMDLMMEAYADAAVKYGIGRDMAYRLVAQTMKGSAKLQQETNSHPGVLKDAVCSPNGTTAIQITRV